MSKKTLIYHSARREFILGISDPENTVVSKLLRLNEGDSACAS
jgi:hypothetical protein